MAQKQEKATTVASYFSKGWSEAMREREKLETLASMRKERAVPKFWMKEGEEAKIMFVDSEPFNIYEHKLEVNGRYESYLCTKEWEVCPICKAYPKSRPSFVNYFTIIDFRPFTTSDGTLIKYQKKLYGAKGVMPKMIYDLIKKKGSIINTICLVKRYTAQSPSSGDYIEILQKVKDPLKVVAKKEDLEPFDYEKIFSPLTEDELKLLGITNIPILGSEEDYEVSDEDIGKIFS